MNEIICEDLMKITQIFTLNYHPTKFGDNCKTQC